jgi:hypothetical protein
MKILTVSCLFFGLALTNAHAENECQSFMKNFFTVESSTSIKTSSLKDLDFTLEEFSLISEAWDSQKTKTSEIRLKKYLTYVLTLSDKDRKEALKNIDQLDQWESNSKYVQKFIETDALISKKIESKKLINPKAQERYTELYYGCRALRPNQVNKNAAKDFKRFNLSLNLGTLGASYAFYNMDKDMNSEWFMKLGYEVGVTVMFSYIGSSIQTKATDTQIVKSLKNYFIGRVMGTTDVLVYDPLFNDESSKAEDHLSDIKKLENNDPEFKRKIQELKKAYEESGLYRRYKNELISRLKQLPGKVGLGVKGKSIDENGVDWNNLSKEDLDRPEVQEVLMAAAMAEVYQQRKGEWIETSNSGVDRYIYNSIYFGLTIPKSIIQNYITYQMLCMGQDNSKLAFTKAVLFNVSASFLFNQLQYGYREKAIGQ